MESGDNKKLQLFARRASGVSRALWPMKARRCIATGRVAQRRRSLIIRGKSWAGSCVQVCTGQSHFMSELRGYIMGLLTFPWPEKLGRSNRATKLVRSPFLRAPETPRLGEPPLIRVLETFDLSHTSVEHFIDPTLGGDTAELPVDWSKETANLTRII